MVELTVEKNSFARYLPNSNDVSAGSRRISTVKAVAKKRLLKTQQARKRLSGCCGDL
jgi:hypothetical protein